MPGVMKKAILMYLVCSSMYGTGSTAGEQIWLLSVLPSEVRGRRYEGQTGTSPGAW